MSVHALHVSSCRAGPAGVCATGENFIVKSTDAAGADLCQAELGAASDACSVAEVGGGLQHISYLCNRLSRLLSKVAAGHLSG